MSNEGGSRRGFIGAGAGIVGAAALGFKAPAALGHRNPHGHGKGHGGHDDHGHGHGHGGRLSPRGRRGVQQWSVRDAITRKDKSASGYLGGRRFPEDASDRGP